MSASFPSEGRLTRAFLCSLPAGVYLVSNCIGRDGQPVYRAVVVAKEHRHRQWRMIKMARTNGRLCRLFQSVDSYLASDMARAIEGGAR